LLPALRDVRLGNLDGISSIAPFLSPSLYSLYVLVEEYLLSPLHNTHVFALNLTRLRVCGRIGAVLLQQLHLLGYPDVFGIEFTRRTSDQSSAFSNIIFPSTITSLTNNIPDHFHGPVPSLASLKALTLLNLRGPSAFVASILRTSGRLERVIVNVVNHVEDTLDLISTLRDLGERSTETIKMFRLICSHMLSMLDIIEQLLPISTITHFAMRYSGIRTHLSTTDIDIEQVVQAWPSLRGFAHTAVKKFYVYTSAFLISLTRCCMFIRLVTLYHQNVNALYYLKHPLQQHNKSSDIL